MRRVVSDPKEKRWLCGEEMEGWRRRFSEWIVVEGDGRTRLSREKFLGEFGPFVTVPRGLYERPYEARMNRW